MLRANDRRGSRRGGFATAGLVFGLVLAVAVTAATVSAQNPAPAGGEATALPRRRARNESLLDERCKAAACTRIKGCGPRRAFRSLRLDTDRLKSVLGLAPREQTLAARTNPLVVTLPAPNGSFRSFALQESAIMAPGLARRHPGIKTYSGRGITDPTATIHADLTPLGFRASVRSAHGAWYIDPYYVRRDPGVYASYYGRDAKNTNGTFVEHDTGSADLSLDQSRPQSTGDQLRTYRLALITDPGYSAYHGGPQFVTAAKVALVNRLTQIYEDDLTIRLQLIANNDLLNLNDYDAAVAPNGPCGSAGCFTQAQVTGCASTTPRAS